MENLYICNFQTCKSSDVRLNFETVEEASDEYLVDDLEQEDAQSCSSSGCHICPAPLSTQGRDTLAFSV